MTHLGETGHVRLGWSTRQGELQAPVSMLLLERKSRAHAMLPLRPQRLGLYSSCRAINACTAPSFSLARSNLLPLSVQVGYDEHSFGYRDLEGTKVGLLYRLLVRAVAVPI